MVAQVVLLVVQVVSLFNNCQCGQESGGGTKTGAAVYSIRFRPGINIRGYGYSNEGGYTDGDKIRFRMGFQKSLVVGQSIQQSILRISARRLHNWIALDSSNFLGIGTHLKYYIEEGTTFNDI